MTSRAAGAVLSSATLELKLLRPLAGDEVLQVALSIFKRLSIDFEMQQAWTDWLSDSSFSQEDLPSNLIGFYMAARHYEQPDIKRFCGVLDRGTAEREFDTHGFSKNRTFDPIGAIRPWPAELSSIDSSRGDPLYEIGSVSVIRGVSGHRFCPLYRIEGTIGAADLIVLSFGGTTFTAADDLQVIPTYQFHEETSGEYGHVTMIEVNPDRQQDIDLLRRRRVSVPFYAPEPVLVCLSSHAHTR